MKFFASILFLTLSLTSLAETTIGKVEFEEFDSTSQTLWLTGDVAVKMWNNMYLIEERGVIAEGITGKVGKDLICFKNLQGKSEIRCKIHVNGSEGKI